MKSSSRAVALAVFAQLLFVATTSLAAERLNILWIISDDLGPELGCYGYEGVSTPNLDRLAAEGTVYTNAFSTSPVCSASRTAFITGMYQTSVGGHHHRTWNMQPLPDGVKPVTEYLRDAGYFVCNGSGNGLAPTLRQGKIDYNFVFDKRTIFDGTDWRQREEKQPFFAQIQIKEPHRAFVKPNVERPDAKIPAFYPDHPITRVDWGNYLASIEKLDERVGEVIQRLKDDGLYESTAIFFFGDHGRPHVRGKQWLYDGGIHTPLIVRIPGRPTNQPSSQMVSLLDIAPTSLAVAGINIPEHMQGDDILGTKFDGERTIHAARDRCGDAFDRIRCVRTRDWKYIRNVHPERSYSQMSGYKKLQYPVLTLMAVMHEQGRLKGRQAEWFASSRPSEELYDLRNDPDELTNLADQPEHHDRLAEMRRQLDEWIETTGDRGAEPEGDDAFLAENIAKKRTYYERTMKRRGLDPALSNRKYLEWWKSELGLR